jgi:hypothetical protein
MRLWRMHVAGNNKIHVGLYAKCPKLLPDFNQIFQSFSTNFYEGPGIKLRGNLSSRDRTDASGQT